MMTKNDLTIESAQSGVKKEHSRQRRLLRLGGAAPAAAFALGLIGSYVARGQVSSLQITALAQGYSPDNNVILHVKGPSDVL